MTDTSTCTRPNDYSFLHGFTGHFQVNNATNSIYSNLYLNPPANTDWGIATLTSEPQESWWMGGSLRYMCSRASYVMKGSSLPGHSDIWSGIQINIGNTLTGREPVVVIAERNSALVFNVTTAFYVETLSQPLSLNVKNPGSYFGTFFYFSLPSCRSLYVSRLRG